MRWLIVSDAHGNRYGLQQVLESRTDFDTILCLGDTVGYGAHPNECCELLREREAICLSGNHDAAVLGKIATDWFNPVAKRAVEWTRETLTEDNRTWLDSLPAQQTFPDHAFQAVHASLREPWEEYIIDTEVAIPNFVLMEQPVLFFGHTHQAVCASLTADRSQWRNDVDVQWLEIPAGAEIELDEGELTMINPGSCGQPRDGQPGAKGAIWDDQTREVEIFIVAYPVEAARSAIIRAGLPAMLGDRLLRGR